MPVTRKGWAAGPNRISGRRILLPTLLRVLKPSGRIAISTLALEIDPYLQAPPEGPTLTDSGEPSVTDVLRTRAGALTLSPGG